MASLRRRARWALVALVGTAGCFILPLPEPGEILRGALEAMGGPERGYDLVVFATGTLDKTAEGQGIAPLDGSPGRHRETLALDSAGGVAWWSWEDRYDGTFEAFGESYPRESERRYFLPGSETVIPAVTLGNAGFGAARRRLTRRSTPVILEELLRRPELLEVARGAEQTWRVRGQLRDGTAVEVALSRIDGLPREVSYEVDLPGRGPQRVTWWYDDYRFAHHGGLVARLYGSRVGGLPYTEMRVDSVTPDAERWIDGPTGWRTLPEREVTDPDGVRDPSPLELRTLAPGIHVVPEVRSGFAPLVVEVEEGLLVVDAPASFPLLGQIPAGQTDPGPSASWASERFVDALAERFPDRPVRYLVLTHAHEDHMGGVRAFVAAGATVLASGELRGAVERAVSLDGSGDRLAASPAPLRFEAVDGARTLGSGGRSVEILDVGANPHARGLLVVHLPGQRALYVSDLATPAPLDRYPDRSHEALDAFLAGWIADRGIGIDRVWAMHGTGALTRAHLARVGG